jgi:hypothetical protein
VIPFGAQSLPGSRCIHASISALQHGSRSVDAMRWEALDREDFLFHLHQHGQRCNPSNPLQSHGSQRRVRANARAVLRETSHPTRPCPASVRCAPQLRLTHSTSGTSALLRARAHNALDGEARPQRGVCAKAASLSCRVAVWLLVPRVSFDGRKKTGLLRTKLKRGERRRSTETWAVTALSSTKSVRQALG